MVNDFDLGHFDFPKLILTEYSKRKNRTQKTFVSFAVLKEGNEMETCERHCCTVMVFISQ